MATIYYPSSLITQAQALIEACRAHDLMIATAESCTAGLIAALLTEVAGSSAVVDRGFVTYSNDAKQEMLGVPSTLLNTHGAVSEPVARAMAEGALHHCRATLTAAVTGIAGPGGGSDEKPVGTVHLACSYRDATGAITTQHELCLFDGNRQNIRLQTVEKAIEMMTQLSASFS